VTPDARAAQAQIEWFYAQTGQPVVVPPHVYVLLRDGGVDLTHVVESGGVAG
jgi:hypothetical protein